MNNSKDYQRKNLLVNPKFQLSFLSFFLFCFLINVGILFAGVNLFFKDFANAGIEAGLASDHIFFKFIEAQQFNLYSVLIISFLFCTLFMIFGGVYLSHKVAGPVYRVCEDLKRMKENNDTTKRIKFRAGDYFPELEEEVNQYLDWTSHNKVQNQENKNDEVA